MNRPFTTREKVLMVILVLLIIAIGYFKLLLEPINQNIENYQNMTADEQDQILINTTLIQKKRQMEAELEAIFAEGEPTPIPVYDNSVEILNELHSILDGSTEYTLSFSNTAPMDVSYLVMRPVNLSFHAASYAAARRILNQLHDSANVNCISDLTVQFDSGDRTTNEILLALRNDDAEDYPITVTVTITYYERVASK